jgi:hypothetical protein
VYARTLWNDGVGKNWLRDPANPDFQADMQAILDYLNTVKIRATYQAVAGALGIHYDNTVPLLGVRRPEASWVVEKDTHEPISYRAPQKHPDLYEDSEVIYSEVELRLRLGW